MKGICGGFLSTAWRATQLLLLFLVFHPTVLAMDFNRQVRPILADKCFQCHGPDSANRAAGLRLDTEEAAKADRGGYRAVDVDSPSKSALLTRIDSSDDALVMPPRDSHKELTGEEKRLLREWIEQGAVWSAPWAYVQPSRTPPPQVGATRWPINWIDNFVLRRLEDERVAHAPDADPVTLVRRLSFDLTGLPPTPEVVDAFVADKSERAYERLVDGLLASPHFGERMAIYWLDLVRFADTVGYHGDQGHGVWPYRDYVIHAFNENKPFNDFTVEQIAGDLLPDSDVDDKIATAYNRLLQTSHEGGVQLKEYRAIYLADRVRNVSQVWMGATMGCCQCHDHKFDPLSMKEFYSLGAFFADIDDEAHLRDTSGKVLNHQVTIRQPELPVLGIFQRKRLARLDAQIASIQEQENPDAKRLAKLKKQRKAAAKTTSTMISAPSKPRQVRVLPRGNWQDETGELVQPNAPEALGWSPRDRRATRLDLAEWLTDSDEGAGLLTARVMVNRFWYLLFGEGLAPVLDDFGGQGQPPTHSGLLDSLAVEFVDSGWDVKHVMKLIVMSHAYRQSSIAPPELLARDPQNQLVARQGRYRLPAEVIRDTALTVSRLLDHEVGGPSVKPYQPEGYYHHLNFPKRKYVADTNRQQWRRGVYVHWQRQFLHPMLKAFDAPNREECTAKRPRSSTPLASLTLLNDPTFVEAARSLATDLLTHGSADTDERISTLYRRALSRLPDQFERRTLQELLAEQHAFFSQDPKAAEELLGVGLKPAPGAGKPELASWTFVCRAVLNLGEATTRN